MKYITPETHLKLIKNNCLKGKHRLRTNKFGVTFCVICGLVSNSLGEKEIEEDDKITISNS